VPDLLRHLERLCLGSLRVGGHEAACGDDLAAAGAAGVERRVEVDEGEGSGCQRRGDLEVGTLDDVDGAGVGRAGHGTRCSHASVANLLSTRASAAAYSSAEIAPSSAPVSVRKVALKRSMISARSMPVCVRSGSTRLAADVVPLSLSF